MSKKYTSNITVASFHGVNIMCLNKSLYFLNAMIRPNVSNVYFIKIIIILNIYLINLDDRYIIMRVVSLFEFRMVIYTQHFLKKKKKKIAVTSLVEIKLQQNIL